MSKIELKKVLKLIENGVQRENILHIMNNKMDIGKITEDEASVIEYSLLQSEQKPKIEYVPLTMEEILNIRVGTFKTPKRVTQFSKYRR